MQAVILAAGLGSRLGALKGDGPKGFLQPKGLGESLVGRSIRLLLECGISEVIIVSGFRAEYYERLALEINASFKTPKIRVIKNEAYENTGSAKSLECAKAFLKEDTLVLESDLLYEKRMLETIINHPNKNLILSSSATESGDEVFLECDDAILPRLVALSKNKKDLDHIDGELVGICKLSREVFFDLDFNKACDYEYLLVGLEALKIEDGIWCEIDDKEHLQRAEQSIIPRLKDKELR